MMVTWFLQQINGSLQADTHILVPAQDVERPLAMSSRLALLSDPCNIIRICIGS